jgi:hypothetical protein
MVQIGRIAIGSTHRAPPTRQADEAMIDEKECTCGILIPDDLQRAVCDGTFTGTIVPVPMYVLDLYPNVIQPPDIAMPWLRDSACPYHQDKPLAWNRERGVYIREAS